MSTWRWVVYVSGLSTVAVLLAWHTWIVWRPVTDDFWIIRNDTRLSDQLSDSSRLSDARLCVGWHDPSRPAADAAVPTLPADVHRTGRSGRRQLDRAGRSGAPAVHSRAEGDAERGRTADAHRDTERSAAGAAGIPMRYRDLLTIEKPVRTTDPQTRQRIDSWTTLKTVRGTISVASASDRLISDVGRDLLITHRIRVPSNSVTRQITPAMRVVSGGQTYHIEAVTDPDGRRRELVLQVTQIVPKT